MAGCHLQLQSDERRNTISALLSLCCLLLSPARFAIVVIPAYSNLKELLVKIHEVYSYFP